MPLANSMDRTQGSFQSPNETKTSKIQMKWKDRDSILNELKKTRILNEPCVIISFNKTFGKDLV